ncbi:MAG TPA: DMT family transporter [Streptosporangiaceae bacterium]|nr:DMT family transporter [Streptosporangiaceae bacterium]
MGTILALAAAVLYGSADFLGGAASRRARPAAVLAVTVPAGAAVTLVAALIGSLAGLGGPAAGGATGLAWGVAGGAVGAAGLVLFYAGFASAPMSVVAPVSALVATLLPLGVAIAGGERPGPSVVAGGLICLAAVVLVSLERGTGERTAKARLRGLGYGVASGALFGLFFLFFRAAGASGVLWPVAAARVTGSLVAFGACAASRIRPAWWGSARGVLPMALASGVVDASANVSYVLATRLGVFGIAVVITALYPGVTVLLARVILGERMRWVQRVGLVLAGLGVALVTI